MQSILDLFAVTLRMFNTRSLRSMSYVPTTFQFCRCPVQHLLVHVQESCEIGVLNSSTLLGIGGSYAMSLLILDCEIQKSYVR